MRFDINRKDQWSWTDLRNAGQSSSTHIMRSSSQHLWWYPFIATCHSLCPFQWAKKNKITKRRYVRETATLCTNRKDSLMPKFTKGRAVTNLPMSIVVLFIPRLAFHRQRIQTQEIISSEKRSTGSDWNGDVRAMKTTLVGKHYRQLCFTENVFFLDWYEVTVKSEHNSPVNIKLVHTA